MTFPRVLARKLSALPAARRTMSTGLSPEVHAFLTQQKKPSFKIIDSTLREGEQFSTTEFTASDRIFIAKMLDKLGVDYIEVVNPMAGKQAVQDCTNIAKLNLKAKVVAHTRCHMSDVQAAVDTGIDGVNMYMATSPILAKHSHGKGIDEVLETAREVIDFVKRNGLEVRFSCEDTFRSNREDILKVYKAVDSLGVNRIGIADTVGVASPLQVYETVSAVRSVLKPETDIEFHAHDDTGCCIANALVAMQAGVTHIDTSVLGIGERNGITPLGGLLARMYTLNGGKYADEIRERYDLQILPDLDRYVAQRAFVTIPFNNYITGSAAFTHKAGVHSKAVMNNPGAYEVLNPQHFGVDRRIQLAHRLTGWNAMAARAKDMGLEISDDAIKTATVVIKNISDTRKVYPEDVEMVLKKLSRQERLEASEGEQSEPSGGIVFGSDMEAAEKAIQEAMGAEEEDDRMSITVEIKGHLFDKALLNRILDVAQDNNCESRVVNLKVGGSDDLPSKALLSFYAHSPDCLVEARSQIDALVEASAKFAECSIKDVTEGSINIRMPTKRSAF